MQMVLVYHSCFSRVPGYFYASKRWFAFCFLVLFVLVLLLLLSFSYSFPFGWLFFCSLSPLLVFVGLFSFFSLFCVLHDSLSLSLFSLSLWFLPFLCHFVVGPVFLLYVNECFRVLLPVRSSSLLFPLISYTWDLVSITVFGIYLMLHSYPVSSGSFIRFMHVCWLLGYVHQFLCYVLFSFSFNLIMLMRL